MSWIKNHFRHFVLPGIHTLAKHQGRSNTAPGGLTITDIKPRDKQVRPSTKCKFVEAGLLYSLISSVLRKGDPTREIALGLCRQIGRAKDAEFVYAIDSRNGIKGLGDNYNGVEGSDVLHSMLCNSMRRLKRKMRRSGSLLLPGRDVWAWEVMARKLSVKSTFDPRVSRGVARSNKALRTCIDEWKVKSWEDVLFFDTGFSGSIPRAIAKAEGLPQINMLLLSSGTPKHQIFRTHTGSRAKALAFEYLAKYFVSGTARDGAPYQELNPLDEFIKAALLTTWLWYHVSPARLPSYRDKKILRGNITINNTSFSKAPSLIGKDILTIQPMTSTGSIDYTTVYGAPGGFGGVTAASASDTSTWSLQNSATTTDIQSLQTLDSLWGTGTSGTLLVDGLAPSLLQQMKSDMDKKIINDVFTTAVKAAPHNSPIVVPVEAPQKSSLGSKQLKALAVDPKTFKLIDPGTGLSVEQQLDAKTLDVLKGNAQPTEAGFELGQYPGPPVVQADALKELAGVEPDGPLPEVTVSIEMDSDLNVADGHPVAFKKATLLKADGTKKVYKTPITG